MAIPAFGTDDAMLSRNGERLSDVAYARVLEILFERRLPAGAFVSQNELVKLTGVPGSVARCAAGA